MKALFAAVTAAALVAGTSFAAQAQKAATPGHEMQEKGSVKGSPGASGYAPGHEMQEKGSVKGTTGASGYAPGHATTGAKVKGDADIKAGKTGVKTGVDADVKVK
jgi:hypothetical protein